MKFTTTAAAAAAATTFFGLSLAQVKYEYVHVTNYVTVGANGQATTTTQAQQTPEQPSASTWVFSTNILGQNIAFTSVVTNPAEAGATLYRENLVIQSGDSLTTEKVAVIANPSTLTTSTLSEDEASSESGSALVSFTPSSQSSQPTQQAAEATSTSATSTSTSGTSTSAPTTTSQQQTTSQQSAAPATTSSSSSPSSTSSTSSGDFGNVQDESFSKDILDAHNSKRALHGVSALSWDQDAYQYAQNYANQYSCSGNLQHSGGKYGENLGVGYKSGSTVVDAWYDEGNNYNYNTASSFDHFTQVVWEGTTKVGCAYKDCSAQNWGKYIICSYDPAGNIVGQGKANIKALV
ncbi:hypothetical protein KGF57_002901 [Candida theae]|uniref:SCP domain-containing protein n=1 Tax=Candida theae TaxID=1198502 RepID=A0AAD5BF57_9ASCO|nr:uncharacterized protein KGF57_002901 [Candida theae]KAI5958093.1 hypothetical protein KGF57_002901 [Candida theae]